MRGGIDLGPASVDDIRYSEFPGLPAMEGVAMFIESRFEQEIDRLCRRAAIPLRLELWDGRRFDFSPDPTVTVAIPRRSALQYFIAPDLNKLGEAFVEGHIRVEGPILEVFKVPGAHAGCVHAGRLASPGDAQPRPRPQGDRVSL
jgi:hypothetical protein